jgi:hypothetical protein
MGTNDRIETDYLVVGAGALGMGVVDTLIERCDADVVMIDRRHRPGGHWLDSYPFVQLHQPSMNYGVNSTPLGHDRVEPGGRDAGFYERAAGTEICGYYDELMRHRFEASGRVRFFPMCDYLGNRRFRSRLTGTETDVTVRRRVVDATYLTTHVPATDAPPFEVGDGVNCTPVGGLTSVTRPAAGYVVIGAGKTGMDAACWLLDQGTAPEQITWIRPRESWILNRAYFQPETEVVATFEGVVRELEAAAAADSVADFFERIEAGDIVFRIDPSVEPEILRGATASRGELEQLRRIENVVRLGHVRRIDTDTITLDQGTIPTSPGHLHVHCATAGLADVPPKPIFTDEEVTPQVISRVSLCLSATLIGVVEASERSTAEKNRLLVPNPWPQTPFGWLRHLLTGMRTELGWQDAPELNEWMEGSRLNLLRGIGQYGSPARVAELQGRFLTAVFPALAKLDELAAHASEAERAHMFVPAPV